MIPEGWVETTLGEQLETINGGGTPPRNNPSYWGGEIPWATVKDLKGTFLNQTEETITELGLKHSAANLIPHNTVIVATRMALGKAVKFSCDVAINQDLKALFPRKSLDSDFLFWWYLHVSKQIEALGSGSTVKGIRLEHLQSLEMLVPPIQEQIQITRILSYIEAAIRQTQAVIKNTRRVKQGLLQQLLTRGIGHTRFKQTEIGEIPEEWELRNGSELFELGGGHAPKDLVLSNDGDVLYLKVDDFNLESNFDGLVTSQSKLSIEQQKTKVRVFGPGTVVFPKRGAAIFKNRVQVLKRNATVDSNLMCLTVKQGDPEFLCFYLRFLKLSNLSDNSGVPQLNNKHLYPRMFPVPPLLEQQEIAVALQSIVKKEGSEFEGIDQWRHIKSGLMQDLLTGRVRVKVEKEAA